MPKLQTNTLFCAPDFFFPQCSSPYTGPVVDTFKLPRGIAISGSNAYIVNTGTQSVTSCSLSGGVITTCSSPYTGSAGTFDVPYYIAISGSKAYITNISAAAVGPGPGAGSIAVCSISSGVISCTDPPYSQAGAINGPYGIAISGSLVYIANYTNSIAVCTLDNSGAIILNSCTAYPSANLNTPSGIAIDGSTAYVTNEGGQSVTTCSIGSNGAILSCGTPYTGLTGTFNKPEGIALA
jgi:hypothetical protein